MSNCGEFLKSQYFPIIPYNPIISFESWQHLCQANKYTNTVTPDRCSHMYNGHRISSGPCFAVGNSTITSAVRNPNSGGLQDGHSNEDPLKNHICVIRTEWWSIAMKRLFKLPIKTSETCQKMQCCILSFILLFKSLEYILSSFEKTTTY